MATTKKEAILLARGSITVFKASAVSISTILV
jgi:hypothetical protein